MSSRYFCLLTSLDFLMTALIARCFSVSLSVFYLTVSCLLGSFSARGALLTQVKRSRRNLSLKSTAQSQHSTDVARVNSTEGF
jgi:hypothetical protein